MVMVPKLGPGEDVLWENIVSKGLIKREVVEVQRLTNYRVMQNERSIGLPMVDDILVMNSHSVSQGQFVSVGRYTRVGMGSGRSRTVGDVVFMRQGKPFIVFRQIGDPHGLERLAKSTRKAAIGMVRKESAAVVAPAPEIPVGEPEPTGPTCPKCGAATMEGASFCAKCGLPLE